MARMTDRTHVGSAVAAYNHMKQVYLSTLGEASSDQENVDLDLEQEYVSSILLPYAGRLTKAQDPMVELPHILFDLQDKMMLQIVSRACRNNAPDSKTIALLGGIQINTPAGDSDYFLPLRFDLRDGSGAKVNDLTGTI